MWVSNSPASFIYFLYSHCLTSMPVPCILCLLLQQNLFLVRIFVLSGVNNVGSYNKSLQIFSYLKIYFLLPYGSANQMFHLFLTRIIHSCRIDLFPICMSLSSLDISLVWNYLHLPSSWVIVNSVGVLVSSLSMEVLELWTQIWQRIGSIRNGPSLVCLNIFMPELSNDEHNICILSHFLTLLAPTFAMEDQLLCMFIEWSHDRRKHGDRRKKGEKRGVEDKSVASLPGFFTRLLAAF